MDPQSFGTPQNQNNTPTDDQPIPGSTHQPGQVFGAGGASVTPQNAGIPAPNPYNPDQQSPAPYLDELASPQPAVTPTPNSPIFSANSKPLKTPRNRGKLLKQISLIGGLIVILVGIWLGFQYFGGYSSKTLDNGGYQYSFTFANNAKTVSLKGKNYLEGKAPHSLNTLMVIGEPTTDNYISSCADVGSSWNSSFQMTLSGDQYLVCTVNNHSVYMTVVGHRSDSSHHMIEISSQDGTTAITQTSAKSILDSIEISQP